MSNKDPKMPGVFALARDAKLLPPRFLHGMEGSTRITEAGGIVIYSMTVDVAEQLVHVLDATGDSGFRADAREMTEKVELVRVVHALAGDLT